MRQAKDATGKWLIGWQGDSVLKIAGYGQPDSWKSVQSELSIPRRLPDGLIEATYAGSKEPLLFLVEIETFSDPDIDRQVFEDLLLCGLNYPVLPEVIVLILKPRGRKRPQGKFRCASPSASVTIEGNWKVIELWSLDSEELFNLNDAGVVPWIPLTQTKLSPTALLKRCREEIERNAPPKQVQTLLTATRIMASAVISSESVLDLLLRSEKMLILPELERIKKAFREEGRTEGEADGVLKGKRTSIVELLEDRFGKVLKQIPRTLETVSSFGRLRELQRTALTCSTLAEFLAEAKKPSTSESD